MLQEDEIILVLGGKMVTERDRAWGGEHTILYIDDVL